MPWTKSGNFNTRITNLPPGALLVNRCTYTSQNPALVTRIELLRNIDGTIRIEVDFKSVLNLMQFRQKLGEKNLSYTFYDGSNDWYTTLTSQDPVYFATCLKVLIGEDGSVNEIIKNIGEDLGIQNLGLTLEKLIANPIDEAIPLAIQAQDYKAFDLAKNLLDYYWAQSLLSKDEQVTNLPLEKMYELAIGISTDSPYYCHAQDYCVDILMRLDDNLSQAEQPQVLEEKAQSLDEADGFEKQNI